MKKIILWSSIALAGLFAACDDDYIDKFDVDSSITDVKNQTFTLTDADYSALANLPANKELALSKDPENKTYLDALKKVGEKGYFTDDITADEFLPAFLASRFPHADMGSKFVVTYNQYKAPAAYLEDFDEMTAYTLTSKDYKVVWGNTLVAPFLTPSTLNKIPALLSANVQNPEEGKLLVVNYAYSETEPSYGEEAAKVYQQTDKFEGEGNYVIVAKAKDGKYYPFGKLKNQSYGYGYMYPNPIEIVNDIVGTEVGSECVVAVESAKSGFLLRNAWEQYLYMDDSHNSFSVSTAKPSSGGEWIITANGDGTFKMVNVMTDKTVKLNYFNQSYSFGAYPSDKFTGTSYFAAAMEKEDGFKAYNVSIGEGTTYVWSHDKERKLWKAGTFVGGKNVPAESYLVSPEIDLTAATAPRLSFDMACNHLKGAQAADHFTVWVSTDFTDNVTTAQWTKVNVPNWPKKDSWNMVPSGAIDLTAFKGKKVRIGFRYVATGQKAPTWQLKNLKVEENVGEYYNVMLYKEIGENELARASRAGEVAPTASLLFRYSATGGWSEYKNDAVRVVVVDPAIYTSVGADFLASPETVLPTYLAKKYPYAEEDARMAVVYNAKKDTPAVMEFTFQGGWATTSTKVASVMTFMKDKNGISANTSVYLDSSLLGDEAGFKIQNVSMGGASSEIWTNQTRYGWVASGHFGNDNLATESWLVSPALNFKKATAPVLTFEEAINFCSEPDKFMTVVVLTDYKGDVLTATKSEPLAYEGGTGSSWDYVPVGPVDLSAYVGQTIHLAFRYTSTAEVAAKWEFKNIKVIEKDEE